MKVILSGNGKPVLYQKPNLPIIVWSICLLLGLFIDSGRLGQTIDIIGFGAIFTWAWLEIFSGVNLLRRLVGAVVLLVSILNQLN